ncbi:MAG: polysaccharide biosynthesis protein [Phycisphaerales bacterium]|nr:polysaccharide biosynthesis protein [Phycisphaerales bacterium]
MTDDKHWLIVVGTARTVPEALGRLATFAGGYETIGVVGVTDTEADALGRLGLPVPVLGTASDLADIHAERGFGVALVSLPHAMSAAIGRIRASLRRLGVAERFLPTFEDVLARDPESLVVAPGEMDLSRLIGRSPRCMNEPLVRSIVGGKRVLITGAGGSIGSELARICAAFGPAQLILMDRSDNALFEIDRQVKARWPDVERKTVLHDVVDAEGTLRRLVGLKPDVVFHAAAHKHVPLMEDHPSAAVNNNLFGTKSVADAALAVNAERFVLISTDKAVNPTSVMGATKRLAEQYVRSLNGQGRTRFSLVRFGNVLGSACSVLPIWAKQIAEGGPVTVTHPEMTRFFMTIPEAASLVIQAAGIENREVFVLDMGEPLRIADLAQRFIRAHGLEPAEAPRSGAAELGLRAPRRATAGTMPIQFTGPRPGEKLYEELAYAAEELEPTGVDGVLAWAGSRPDRGETAVMVAELSAVRHTQDGQAALAALHRHVPELRRMVKNTADTGDISISVRIPQPEAA